MAVSYDWTGHPGSADVLVGIVSFEQKGRRRSQETAAR